MYLDEIVCFELCFQVDALAKSCVESNFQVVHLFSQFAEALF